MARRSRSGRTRKKAPKEKKVQKTEEVEDPKIPNEPETMAEMPKSSGSKSSKKEKDKPKGSTISAWWNKNRNTVLILLGIFVLAFLIREFFYYQISFSSWPPNIVGNDPSYHKRVIDFVQDEYHHIRIDDLLNYPLSSGNPRPPIFDWSIAIVGIALSPFFGFNVGTSTWYVYQFAPTFWGAMTIFPMYLLGKEIFGKKAGLMAAFLLALTASHIERSTLGFTDHDSFIVFFVVLSMYFLSKSFSVQKDRNYISDWRKPHNVVLGFRSYFQENKEAMFYAVLTGLSMATIALTWEGYSYVLAILLIYYLIQLLLHRFRNEDSTGTFTVMYIAMGLVVLLSLPYYYSFSIATWSQGFYIFLAMTMLGLFIVPTRDVPWLIVIPTLILFLGASYAVMKVGFPETADLLFTGGGYFVSNKLYDTIAEAQAPEISRLVFTMGPGTFFLALVGVVMAFVKIPKNFRKDYLVIVIWTAVAIFMALSATRFNINATPAFALLAGWTLVTAIKWLKASSLSILYSIIGVVVLLVGLGIVYEGWGGPVVENYMLITLGGTTLISFGIFAFMKYRKNREWFKFRKVIAGLTVGFLIIMPNAFFAVDASIPIEKKADFDPDYDYLGSFGSSLHSDYWMDSYRWLATQDIVEDGEYVPPEDRPGFMSWWDYGFDELLLGQHPTAADNFQNGYHFTGSMIASQNETEAISLMTARIIEGDFVNNQAEFSDEIWDVLVKHLGDDKNSTWSAYEINRIYRKSASYIDDVENNPDVYGGYVDMTAPNARYAAARVVFTRLGEEGVVKLYQDVCEETDTSLRYFAVDYRLFPFSASNTGIFYAPITLADRIVDDYLEYKVYAQENTRGSNEDPDWVDYPDNPISMEKAEEESERLGYKFRIQNYEMFYTENFYNSLFYKTYIGWGPEDVGGLDDGKSVPAMFGELQNYPAMQAWNMTHFKVVYRTMYYSELDDANATFPDDYEPMSSKNAIAKWQEEGGDIKSGLGQGTFYIKYYHGAIVSGKVMTEDGTGAPGIRVTVLDDYGIPHGNVITSENGEYELIVPPGEVTLIASTGDLDNIYDKLYQFQVDQSTGQPMNAIGSDKFEVSDALSMREINNGEMTKNIIIPNIAKGGTVYWDTNDDSSYTEGEDSLITKGEISFIHTAQDDLIFGPYELDESGSYLINGLVPGKYNINYVSGSRDEVLVSDFNVDPMESGEKDIRLDRTEITGTVTYVTGEPADNETVLLMAEDGEVTEIELDNNGNYSIKEVFPGIYTMNFHDNRYYHEDAEFSIGQGETIIQNLTLVPGSDITIRTRYPASYSPQYPSGKLADGSIVSIIAKYNTSLKWDYISDDMGEVEMVLPIGFYDIAIHTIEKDSIWAYLGTIYVEFNSEKVVTPTLEPGFKVSGILTKLVDNPHNNTEVLFERMDSNLVAHSYSIRGGEYSAYLPRDIYTVTVDNRSTANVSYYHMQEIAPPETGSDLDLDIWTPKTVLVSGTAFWDKDGNGEFTNSMLHPDKPILNEEYPLMENIVEFTYSNGTITTETNNYGNFSIELPPGEYEMEVESKGFYTFTRELTVEGTAQNINDGITEINAMMMAKERATSIEVFYSYFGAEEIVNISLDGESVRWITGETFMGDEEVTFITDSDGMIYTEVLPGNYFIEFSREYTENNIEHKISTSTQITVPPGDGVFELQSVANHIVHFEGTLFLMENDLIRYPAEISVNMLAIAGERVSMDATMTDFNGRFEFYLPAGAFVMEAHADRTSAHYMYWDVIDLNEDLSNMDYEMTEGLSIEGDIVPQFDGMKDTEIVFESGSLWTSAGISENGHFSLFMFPGEFNAVYLFQTEESSSDGGYLIEYRMDEEFTVDSPIFGLEFETEKFVELQGAVYHDINGDRTIQEPERMANEKIIFTPLDTDYSPLEIITDENGDYRALMPFANIQVQVDIEGYKSTPREDHEVFYLLDDPLAFRDVAIIPVDVDVAGVMFFDENENGEYDEDDTIISNMDLTFVENEDGSTYFAATDSEGRFSLSLPPGIYETSGMVYSGGSPKWGYYNELNVDMGQVRTDETWTAVKAGRFTGSLFYRNTDGELLFDIPENDGIIRFTATDKGTIEAAYTDSSFQVDLPYYDYIVSSSFTLEEYDLEMTYRISETIDVNEDTGPEDFSLEFLKQKDHSFTIDLINSWEHELEMGPSDTTILKYYIENVGNEPYSISIENTEKPDGWIVELPDNQDIDLAIGERVTRQLNVTTPMDPNFTNSLKFEGTSSQGTKNTFQIQIDTPPSFRFDLGFDIPDVLGVGYGETRVFNLTVQNMGSGEDVVNVQLLPDINTIEGWSVEWEGEPEFPVEGENVSMTPRGQRRYAITIRSPDVPADEQTFKESLTLTFVGKNRNGDVVKKDVSFELTKPNLQLPPGYLKLTNRRLDDNFLNRTIEANISVRSIYKDAAKVNVSLKVDQHVVAQGIIPYIPQDGTGSVRVRFNITEFNLTEDDFHTFQVDIDPYNTVEETDDYDNFGAWYNVVIGETPEEDVEVNWRIVIFIAVILIATLGIIAYRQKNEPI